MGSVVVGSANEIRSTGYNGFPRGVDSLQKGRHDRASGEKYMWFEHAERNAIYNAAASGVSTAGCRMYVNSFPCADCSRAIVQSGIVQLNTYSFVSTDKKFGRQFVVADEMLREAGIEIKIFERNNRAVNEHAQLFLNTRDPARGLIR